MGINYGQKGRIIMDSDVDSIVNTSITSVNINGDDAGSFKYNVTHGNVACGSTSYIIFLKDIISWTHISYKVRVYAKSSCWAFNQGSSYATTGHNLIDWNSSLDKVTKCTNTFELSQFDLKMNTCDNATTNAFHSSYALGAYREFTAVRRRQNISLGLAGPAVGFACTSGGVSEISQIVVWEQ